MRPTEKKKALATLQTLKMKDDALHERMFTILGHLASVDLDGRPNATYQEIGDAMGISRQAAWERHQRGWWRRNPQ